VARTSSSSSLAADPELRLVPMSTVRPHPANANAMSEERREVLARQIERNGRYPPLIVRPDPDQPRAWQLLDGHQRFDVLSDLGHEQVWILPWPCDDETALLLLATLNRLEGEDVPVRRAALLAELQGLMPRDELALLLPEDAATIADTIALTLLDRDALLADLTAAQDASEAAGPRLISFAVDSEDERAIEEAVARAMINLTGRNRRGRALARICRAAVAVDDA